MNADLLEKFVNAYSTKDSYSFIVRMNESIHTIQFENDITLNPNVNYKMGIIWCDGFNGFFNVHNQNNAFKYFNGKEWKTIRLPIGGYSLERINKRIQSMMKTNKDYNEKDNIFNFEIGVEQSQLRTKITLSNGYIVDFTIPNSIRHLLGFSSKMVSGNKAHLADTNANIVENTTLNITSNLVSNFYVNERKTNILFSHPLKTLPGEYFAISPKYVVFLPITAKSFNALTFKLVDLNFNVVSNNGESINFLCVIQQV